MRCLYSAVSLALLAVGVVALRIETEAVIASIAAAPPEGGDENLTLANLADGWNLDGNSSVAVPSGANGTGAAHRIVAIFADYDGCFDLACAFLEGQSDLLVEEEQLVKRVAMNESKEPIPEAKEIEETYEQLMAYVDKITAGAEKVILFVGSNRQSEELEQVNVQANSNGHAMTLLRKLAESKGWEFSDARLDKALKGGGTEVVRIWEAQGSGVIKVMLSENNFKELTEPTEVYFFDDVSRYLDYMIENTKVPPHITFNTVHFDHVGKMLHDPGYEQQLQIRSRCRYNMANKRICQRYPVNTL